MVMNNYSVTLEEDVVKEAKILAKPMGGKLSPILNNLLKNWVKEMKKVEVNLDG